jgi:hypothetical protein
VHQRPGLNLAGPVHLRLGQPSIAVNFIATRVPNRATRPYLPRSSSALVIRRQSPANLSRQMATGFGCDECRVGTVVGIRSDRVKEARGWRRSSEGAKSTVGRRGQGAEPPGRLRPGALHLDRHKRTIIRKGDDADQRVSQAPATGGRDLRTDDVVHRPSGWRFPGILPRSCGILHSCRRIGPRPNDLPTPK